MLYRLSKIIPVRMDSLYSASDGFVHFSGWWQWRDRIWGLRDRVTACYTLD